MAGRQSCYTGMLSITVAHFSMMAGLLIQSEPGLEQSLHSCRCSVRLAGRYDSSKWLKLPVLALCEDNTAPRRCRSDCGMQTQLQASG